MNADERKEIHRIIRCLKMEKETLERLSEDMENRALEMKMDFNAVALNNQAAAVGFAASQFDELLEALEETMTTSAE